MVSCPPPVYNSSSSFFFFCCCCCVFLVHGQSQEGFISLDCGIPEGGDYQDATTTIDFTTDTGYIDAGEIWSAPSCPNTLLPLYGNLRSFPNGARNCYRLQPVKAGGKYLIGASFCYGNYDGDNSVPEFDLHVGVNFWTTVLLQSNGGFNLEIITVAQWEYIWVCLVNTGKGTPFISGLRLRPLRDSMYVIANQSQSLILQNRWNYGATSQQRFPYDPYDRLWRYGSISGSKAVISTREVTTKAADGFQVPSSVMRTAFTATSSSGNAFMMVSGSAGDIIYVVLHFAELEQLLPNDTRKMDIYHGVGDQGSPRLLYGNYTPPFLLADARDDALIVSRTGQYDVTVYASASSTRPYLINAFESFYLRPVDGLSTDRRDVDAIEEIKRVYKLKRNWMGDPCAPPAFAWDGVSCSYEDSRPRRIISLNLSSSHLNDGIPASIANLTALTTLDLSNNNLTGTFPDFLAELPSLKLLILTGNQLTGTIPRGLCEKVQNAGLSISIEGDRQQCSQVKRKKRIFIPVTIAASLIFLVLLVICTLLWRIKRRQFDAHNGHQEKEEEDASAQNIPKGNDGLKRESYRFTFLEIRDITRNFEMAIGKGGFGTVYLGHLDNGTQVAVKVLSRSSSQGDKEFQAEALVLTRVHHKRLVSLLGYCDDQNNLALVYEYMDRGNLQDHLSGEVDSIDVLSWERRVNIALHAAQGLDYLHNGCKPAIVHRDVKSTNILLNHDFTAKLADFGLSRAFNNENCTHISTAIAGTPGYLDPEYYQTNRLNEKSDVYSFGVVLLEIITGRPPILNLPEKTHITQWVNSRLNCGDIDNIVDTRLQGDYDRNSIWKALEVALSCTSIVSVERLTMSNVTTQLKDCLVPEFTRNAFSIQEFPLKISSEISPSTR